jgi:hypothetical protein
MRYAINITLADEGGITSITVCRIGRMPLVTHVLGLFTNFARGVLLIC